MKLDNFFIGYGEARSRDVSQRRMVNSYLTEMDGNKVVIGTPCTKLEYSIPKNINGNPRGLHYCSSINRFFGVFGDSLYELYSDGSSVLRHTMSFGTSEVTFVDDGKYMVFVDGYSMFIYDLDTNIVTNPPSDQIDFTNPTKIVYSNGRAVVINADPNYDSVTPTTRKSNRYYWSELRKINEWNPLNFSSAESSPDPIIGISMIDNNLYLFGKSSYEFHRATIDPDAPWTFVTGSNNDVGVMQANTIASNENTLFWLGNSTQGLGKVFMASGSNITNIASNTISSFLNQNKDKLESSYGFVYSNENQTFYVLTLVEIDRTFVYDTQTGLWHERSTRDEFLNIHHHWRARFSQFAFNKIFVADSTSPYLYSLDLDKYQDDIGTKTIPCVRILQGSKIYEENSNTEFFINTFELVLEAGNTPSLTNDPQIMLSFSKDGGYSFGNENWKSIGSQGQYQQRVQWRRLGRFRECDVRIEFSENARFCIKDVLIGIVNQKNHL